MVPTRWMISGHDGLTHDSSGIQSPTQNQRSSPDRSSRSQYASKTKIKGHRQEEDRRWNHTPPRIPISYRATYVRTWLFCLIASFDCPYVCMYVCVYIDRCWWERKGNGCLFQLLFFLFFRLLPSCSYSGSSWSCSCSRSCCAVRLSWWCCLPCVFVAHVMNCFSLEQGQEEQDQEQEQGRREKEGIANNNF